MGIIQMLMKKQWTADIKRLFKYIGIRVVSLIATVLIFKGPNILIHQITQGTFSPSNFIKSTLLVHQEDAVLLATADAEELDIQNNIDKQILDTTNYSPEQCAVVEFTEDELKEGMRESITTNEDVGRYVGY